MRTHYCGKINITDINKIITVYGWVEKKINLGKIIFIKIRDYTGTIQVLFHFKNITSFNIAKKLKNEFCIKVIGIIQKKITKFKIEVEILAFKIKILNTSKSLPIDLNNKKNKDIRFKYRYLDLRRKKILKKFIIRNKINNFFRKFLKKKKFLEIETPILTKSTPEGARDYIVPSRIHKNKFYALPQSPQIFKQLLMISGIDRYYQIAKCFRDEDLRSDRQPEFTQLDLEMSFINSKEIRIIMENMISLLWKKILNVNLKKFKILTYKKSLSLYGTDKPDLRNPLKIIELTKIINNYYNKKKNNKKNRIAALYISKKYLYIKKNIKKIKKIIKKNINKKINLIIIKYNKNKIINIPKNIKNILTKKLLITIIKHKQLNTGDILIYMNDKKKKVNKNLSQLRTIIGKKIKIIKKKKWKPVWIIDFPLFKKNKKGNLSSTNHLFTSPKKINILKLSTKPEKIISDSYDLVINGYEIGGGSVRINNKKIQKLIFDIIKINKNTQKKIFGFFTKALEYGAPPHAGIAFGLDRITMLLTKSKNIREVIAFPKTTTAICFLSNAPL